MTYINNTYIKSFVCFVIIFCIICGFGLDIYQKKVYADFVLTGMAFKIIATLLASMGVLTFVNSNGGLDSFSNGLFAFMEETKGISNALGLFVSLGKDIILNKAKLGASSVVSFVKEYYDTIFKKNVNPGLSSYLVKDSFKFNTNAKELGTYFNGYGLLTGYSPSNYLKEGHTFNYIPIYDILTSGNKYVYNLGNNYYGIISFFGNAQAISRIAFSIYYRDVATKNATRLSTTNIINFSKADYDSFSSSFSFEYSAKSNQLYFSNSLTVYKLNETFTQRDTVSLPSLSGFDSTGETSLNIPSSTSVSNNLDWGWQVADKVGTVVDSLGKTTSEIFEKVNSGVSEYVEALEKAGTKVNDITSSTIVVEKDIVTSVSNPDLSGIFDKVGEVGDSVVDVGDKVGEVGREVAKTNTLLEKIGKSITDIFVTDNITPINFAPLMDIPIKDKFPFSLPWDLQRSFNVLIRPPKPIVFTVPIVSENIKIDLSTFDKWALISRTFLSIIFIIGLVILTGRFIGGS